MENNTTRWIPLLLVLCLPLSWAASAIGSIYRWITLALFGYYILENKAKVKIDESSKTVLISMCALVTYILFSIGWGNSLAESLKSALGFLLMFFVGVVFSSYNYGEVTLCSKLDQIWTIVGIISSILFIFGDRAIIGEYGSRTSLRILGTNTDPNEFAGLFAITLAVNTYYVFNSKGIKRSINFMAMIAGIYSVLLSGSRGAMIACSISILLTLLFCVHASFKSIFSICIIAVLLGMVFVKYLLPLVPTDVVARLDLRMIFADGGGGRSVLWESGIEKYLNSNLFRMLFGYGANGMLITGERGVTGAMHNYYLQLLTNFGLIGFSLYLCLLWNILRKFWGENRKYASALIAMMVLSATLTTTPNYKPLWILMMTSMIPTDNFMDKKNIEEG